MKFYQVTSNGYYDDYHGRFFGTKREALAEARRMATRAPVEVIAVEMDVNRAKIIALANNRGWCREAHVIWSAEPVEEDA